MFFLIFVALSTMISISALIVGFLLLPLQSIQVDPYKLQLNLIKNSWKFMRNSDKRRRKKGKSVRFKEDYHPFIYSQLDEIWV